MAERSAKLGDWDGNKPVERPSFGLKVRTPSPQKPCMLLSQSTLPSDGKLVAFFYFFGLGMLYMCNCNSYKHGILHAKSVSTLKM